MYDLRVCRTDAARQLHGICTTYFTDSSRNVSGREVGAAVGSRGCDPNGSNGQGVRGMKSAEAEDELLIQQQKFCAHSYVYVEIQL